MKSCKKCNGCNHIVSNTVQQMYPGCVDVCKKAMCGDPSVLSLYAPLIYDEIGVNLCAGFALGVDLSTDFPTASKAIVQVINIVYGYGTNAITIEEPAKRPNCLRITLTNLTVQFAVKVYDDDYNLLTTVYPTAVYLPSDTATATYNEDTNPASVTLELFAPYGTSYDTTGDTPSRIINLINQTQDGNFVKQGVNMYAIPKLIDLDSTDDTITVGLTLVLQSLYFAGYNVGSQGRIKTPKGAIIPTEDSDCIKFVCGDLLDLPIKPLNLNPPCCEGNLKKKCTKEMTCSSGAAVTADFPPGEEDAAPVWEENKACVSCSKGGNGEENGGCGRNHPCSEVPLNTATGCCAQEPIIGKCGCHGNSASGTPAINSTCKCKGNKLF